MLLLYVKILLLEFSILPLTAKYPAEQKTSPIVNALQYVWLCPVITLLSVYINAVEIL